MKTATSYSIVTGEGSTITAGVDLRTARRIAKESVARHGAVEICDAATGETVEIVR